jgi:hypothetical protein
MRNHNDTPPAPVIILGLVTMVGIMYPPILIAIGVGLVLITIGLVLMYRHTQRQLQPSRRAQRDRALYPDESPALFTLNPNGQPSILPKYTACQKYDTRCPCTACNQRKESVVFRGTAPVSQHTPPPCTEGGPCRIGHRRVIYALDGTTRVAVLCTKCGRGTPDHKFLTTGTTRLPSPTE